MIDLACPGDTEALGEALGRVLRAGDCVLLSGDLGAGKTTLARGVLRGLGFAGEVASPTFPIVLTYEPPELRLPLWHVDLYRIEDPAELDELALDEARADAALLVEWPERWPTPPPDALRLHLAPDGAGRVLTARVPAAWERRWPPR